MELGATVCGPNRAPNCENCPCRGICLGYQKGTAQQFPVKSPKKEKRQEDRTVFIFCCDGRYAVEKRPDKGLLAGLWQFPNVSNKLEVPQALEAAQNMGLQPREILREVERKHIFTHIQWNMKGIYLEVSEPAGDFQWFTPEQIRTQAALPTAFKQFWDLEDIENV
jgi:A/G-specific adenine glycosylase